MARGFGVDMSQSSADHNGQLETYTVADSHATLLAPGDSVTLTGTAVDGVASVDASVAAAAFTGILTSIEPIYEGEQLSETGLPASTGGTVHVQMDPNLNYIVPVTNGTLVDANVGLNIDLVATAATKSGGLTVSNMSVDAGTVAGTATLPWRIVGLAKNNQGQVDGTIARVRPNNTTTRAGTAGV